MIKEILYIEPVDIHAVYGSGGGPMVIYSNKISEQFIYITYTSKDEKIGTLNTKRIGGHDYKYIPICRTISNGYLKRILPLNIYFVINLLWRMEYITKFGTNKIFTKTYSVLWMFTLLKKNWNVCYVFPGLEHPLRIGRFPKLAKIFMGLFDYISIKSMRRVAAMFVAASDGAIEHKNSELKWNNVPKKIVKIPQAVDMTIYKNEDMAVCKDRIGVQEEYVFVFLGRLVAIKGIELLIEAFGEFNSRHPDSKLLIIGEGELSDDVKMLIYKNKLSEEVVMLGRKEPPELIDYICASEAGIFASHAEGFSNAMLEILSCGVPVITTDVGGVDEMIIEGVTGYVVSHRDAKYYSTLMEKAVSGDLSSNCIQHVKDNFTLEAQWKIIADNWHPLVLNAGDS